MPLGMITRSGSRKYIPLLGSLPGLWHYSISLLFCVSELSATVFTTVMWCLVLWASSQLSYACLAIGTFSIQSVSGSPLGRAASGLVDGLFGILQIGITPIVPHFDVAGARGRIEGATAIRWGFSPGGIEPATFRFVAQHLNHCATAVPKVWRCTL